MEARTEVMKNDEDISEEEEGVIITESEEMRAVSLQQLEDAISLLPLEDRKALEEAKKTSPDLVNKESDPLRFLRFHSFNSWAAARRLAAYWKFRFEVFGHRALLPIDLSGAGAIPPEDVRLLQTGALMMLPHDPSGRSVLYIDRSKLLECESISPAVLFFVQQRLMENEMSGKIGCTTLVNLSNPFGATFQPKNVALAKDIVRKAMPLRVGRVHVVCCSSPSPVQAGQQSFVSSFLPLCLSRLGTFFSKYTEVHVAHSEEEVFRRLRQHGLTREGLPPAFGGTWNGFDEWLVSEKCTLDRSLRLDALVRNTLWAYSEKVGTTSSPQTTSATTAQAQETVKSAAEESLLQDRKAYAHFDIRDYTKEQHRELSKEEREEILRDVYGSTDVQFTITREVEMEGRARKQFDEAMQLLPVGDIKDYLEAKENVPHLVEIESDPLRYLRVEKFNTWNAARRVALYWKSRREVFGERAFLPVALSRNSALKEDEIAMVRTGYMAVMPEDDRGRPIYFLDISRLTVPFTAESRTRCAFYIMQLISERESSRNVGAIGIAVYSKNAPKGSTDAKYGQKATDMARDGVFPCHWRAIHVCAVGIKSNTLRDQYFVPFTLQMLRRWKSLSLRTVVHVDEKLEGIRCRLSKYGIPPSCVPTTVGGTWSYDTEFKNWFTERIEYEKDAYWSGDATETSSSKTHKVSQKQSHNDSLMSEEEKVARDKRRKMDALYARRKRERQRIEIEVLQEQCVEYNNKNSALDKQNKWLEGLLRHANSLVQIHLDGRGIDMRKVG